MKILVDVPPQPDALAALQRAGLDGFDCVTPPAETARDIDPERLKDVEVLFCSIPPKNFAAMNAVKWVQIASAGYTQLFSHDLRRAASARPTRSAASMCRSRNG
jgi:phosphoglycerate dehydrogenase-like enzyme